jgi:hypothetical protein
MTLDLATIATFVGVAAATFLALRYLPSLGSIVPAKAATKSHDVATDYDALERLEANRPARNEAYSKGLDLIRGNFLSKPEAAKP